MDIYMPMATTDRHNHITGTLFGRILDLLISKQVYALKEECALVYWGHRHRPEPATLVEAKDIDDSELFAKTTILELEYVQPDFFLFQKNKYISGCKGLRTAGCPDIIIEVWSESNKQAEKDFKFDLYSTGGSTEHWYIDQDSDTVKCYMGKNELEEQCLTDILKTQNGIEFDLRYLALQL